MVSILADAGKSQQNEYRMKEDTTTVLIEKSALMYALMATPTRRYNKPLPEEILQAAANEIMAGISYFKSHGGYVPTGIREAIITANGLGVSDEVAERFGIVMSDNLNALILSHRLSDDVISVDDIWFKLYRDMWRIAGKLCNGMRDAKEAISC